MLSPPPPNNLFFLLFVGACQAPGTIVGVPPPLSPQRSVLPHPNPGLVKCPSMNPFHITIFPSPVSGTSQPPPPPILTSIFYLLLSTPSLRNVRKLGDPPLLSPPPPTLSLPHLLGGGGGFFCPHQTQKLCEVNFPLYNF